MTFKEMLEEDKNVFLNSDEFGEIHTLNGSEIICIVEDKRKSNSKYVSLNKYEVIIYCSSDDISIERGEMVDFDEEQMLVKEMKSEHGISKIGLEVDEA